MITKKDAVKFSHRDIIHLHNYHYVIAKPNQNLVGVFFPESLIFKRKSDQNYIPIQEFFR